MCTRVLHSPVLIDILHFSCVHTLIVTPPIFYHKDGQSPVLLKVVIYEVDVREVLVLNQIVAYLKSVLCNVTFRYIARFANAKSM